ncbi:hypothetical protein ACWG0P_09010 [Amedibacillus sp. YH-ame6]
MENKQLKLLCVFDAFVFLFAGLLILSMIYIKGIDDTISTIMGYAFLIAGIVFLCVFPKISKVSGSTVALKEDTYKVPTKKEIEKVIPIVVETPSVTEPIKTESNTSKIPEKIKVPKSEKVKKVKKATRTYKPKNIPVTISFVLGALYTLYLIFYIVSINGTGASDAENVGIAIGSILIMPHAICVGIATIFNGLGIAMNKRGFVLTGAILYAVSMVFMFIYFFFVIIQMVLSFVGYSQMKKKSTEAVA